MCEQLVLLGIILTAISGVPGLFLGRHSSAGQWLSVLLAVPGCCLGLAGVAVFWVSGELEQMLYSSPLIAGAEMHVPTDATASFFVCPLSRSYRLSAMCRLVYLPNSEPDDNWCP